MRKIIYVTLFLAISLISNSSFAQISGIVFRDYNGNGLRDTTLSTYVEPRVAGVIINAYNSNDALIASYTSRLGAYYSYVIPASGSTYNGTIGSNTGSIANNADVRLEFVIPNSNACHLNSSLDFYSVGGANATSVQFLSASRNAATINQNFGINNPDDYVFDASPFSNTNIFIAAKFVGNPAGGGTAKDMPIFFKFPFNRSGSSKATGADVLSSSKRLGSIHGVAYSKQANKIFVGAYLRRHAGFGPADGNFNNAPGAIYMIDPTKDSSQAVSYFMSLDAKGFPTHNSTGSPSYGRNLSFIVSVPDSVNRANKITEYDSLSYKTNGLGVIGTNIQRGLPAAAWAACNDAGAYGQIGRVSLGDIDISEDGRHLFVTNLYDRKIYQFAFDDVNNPTNARFVRSYSLPNPPARSTSGLIGASVTYASETTDFYNGNKGYHRPFGLKYYRGKLYVGGTTTGENNGVSLTEDNSGNCEYTDLWSYVWELDTSSGFNTTPLLQIPLNFFRGINQEDQYETFRPWTMVTPKRYLLYSNTRETMYPQAMLSDIEFDVEGSLMLAFRDRFGDQVANLNRILRGDERINNLQAGDIMRAYRNPNTCNYELEFNGKEGKNSPKPATSGKGNKQGLGDTSNVINVVSLNRGNNSPIAWSASTLRHVKVLDNANFATSGPLNSAGKQTQRLQVTNLGLNAISSLYGTYTISVIGIEVKVHRKADVSNSVIDDTVRLLKNGIATGSNYAKSNTTYWPTATSVVTYGGSTDLWGASWSISDINNANFGAMVRAKQAANSPSASVDHIEVIVYYRTTGTNNYNSVNTSSSTNYVVSSNGANAGEFYYNDEVDSGPWMLNAGEGSLAFLKGSERIVSTTVEPYSADAGLKVFNNNSGASTSKYTVVEDANIAKGGGLGDLELFSKVAPITIGNRVWNDANADGIQTAGESGIGNVNLELYADFNSNGLPDTIIGYNSRFKVAPGSATTTSAGGSVDWNNASNVFSNNNSYATVALSSGSPRSYSLNITNFGLSIPSNATITGLQVTVHRFTSGGTIVDSSIRLYSGGKIGSNLASGTSWPTSEAAITYGDSTSNSWVYGLSPSLLNSSGFGISIAARRTAASGTLSIDYVELKVNYTVPTSPMLVATTTTSSSGTIGEYYFNNANVSDGNPYVAGSQLGLQPNKTYLVRLATSGTGNDWDPTLNGGTGGARSGSNLDGFQLTQSNKTGNGAADWSDNDATLFNAIPQISVTTGNFGENNHTYDFGFDQLAAIGDKVWRDDDKDGTQDAGEPGVAGITVTLYQNGSDQTAGTTDDIVIGSTVTDAYGNYLFDNLTPTNQTNSTTIGQTSYNVGFTLPANYQYTTANSPGDNGNNTNSDANLYSGRTGGYNLIGGEYDATADAGIIFNQTGRASVGDYVWFDSNSDDDQDAGEPGVSGVTVTLYNSAGTGIIATTITDANGYYLFTDVAPATYKIGFSLPPGTVFTGNSGALSTTNNSDAITTAGTDFGRTTTFTLNSGDHIRYIDAGIEIQSTTKASLGDYVWFDNNRDGIQDQNEPGVGGVTVNLKNSGGTVIATTKTDAYGYYIFNNLTPGSYSVQFTAPSGMQITAKNQGSVGNTDSDADPSTGNTVQYTLIGGEKNMTVDCGFYGTGGANTVGALGDYVWYDTDKDGVQDNTEYGVAGITVTLYNNGGTAIATTSTDNTGYYLFTNLTPSNYSVGFSNIPLGYQLTSQDQGGDDTKDSDANTGTGRTAQVAVSGGAATTTLDAGIFKGAAAGLGSLGNRVWYDMPVTTGGTNGNGLQDAGELGVAGVTVELLDGSGNSIDPDGAGSLTKTTTLTNALGEYMFTGLNAGSYMVEFSNLPSGFSLTSQNAGSDDEIDSDGGTLSGGKSRTGVYTLAQGEDNLTVDLGIKPPANTNSLGNYVWYDTDADGIQDGTEIGVPGAMVTLYYGSGDKAGCGTDNLATNFSSNSHNSGTLNFNGNWTTAGTVNFTGNTMQVLGNSGSSQRLVNLPVYGIDNVNISFTLTPSGISASGETFIVEYTKDGGTNWVNLATYNGTSANTGAKTFSSSSTADLVNMNGIRFREGVYANGDYVAVSNLDISFSENCAPVTTTTNMNGEYLFAGLTDGTYSVGFSNIPAGFNFTTKSSTNDATGSDANILGLTPTVTLGSGNRNDRSLDAGLVSTRAALGNYVWHDINKDGDQDANEPPIAGVTVTLYQGSNTIATAITNEDGLYLFPNLNAGSYEVGFSTVPEMKFTVKDATTESAGTDSDVDPATGKTASISLAAGEVNLKIDAGLYVEIPARLGNYVWSDRDKDGVQDANENGVAGALVVLYNSSNVAIASAVTDGNGYYEITNIPTGNGYYLIFTANLPGFDVTGTPGTNPAWTTQNVGTNATSSLDSGTESDTDSDVTKTGGNAGKTSTFGIDPGDNFPNMDAGIINAQTFSPLPVTWLKFKATLVNGEQDVHLDWSTATEINNSHFEVERSFDGRTFTKIATVQSKGVSGYSSVILNYASLDKGVNVYGFNTLFYRIKQVDYDGKFDYTPIEIVYLKDLNHVSVFPNPATEELNFHFNSELFRDNVIVNITDFAGRTVYESVYYPSQISTNKSSVNIKDLDPGYYTLSLSDGVTTKVFKFLKK